MSPEQFCYWLQGFFELTRRGEEGQPVMGINHEQTVIIRDHLNTVFNKVTPDRSDKAPRVLTEKQMNEAFGVPVVDVNPFDRPDVYCMDSSQRQRRIC